MATEPRRPKVSGGTVLRGVDGKAYNRLRDHPGNDRFRMSYLDGTLILMSPADIHDDDGRRPSKLVDEVTEALEIFVQDTRTTTLRRRGEGRRKGSAKEPDHGLAIAIDHKADSTRALALYARPRVPEVWRYKARSRKLWFGRLVEGAYVTVEHGLNLPRLTPSLVLVALGRIDEMGETASKARLREWARGLPEPAA